jgi:hypothetical protein
MAVTSVVMKIYEYDPSISAFLVAFNSTSSETNIDEQPRYSYRLSMFDTTDINEILRQIARSGISVAEVQDKEEAIKKDPTSVDVYQNQVGQTLTFEVADLYNDQATNTQSSETITI